MARSVTQRGLRDARQKSLPLLPPFARNGICHLRQLNPLRLTAIYDSLLNIRRQEGQPQQAVDEAPRNLFGVGDLCSRPIRPILDQPLPPVRPGERAYQPLVRPLLYRSPRVAAVG